MKSKDLNSQGEKKNNAIIQRKEQSSFIKPKDANDRFTAPKSTNTSSKKVPNSLQSNLETSFGQDFSNVNIHTNSQKALQMNARAFTQNEQIHFAPGEFNPSSTSGQHLIGHEFTHIAQQCAGVVKPTKRLKKGVMVNDDRSLESEADSFGKKAVKGEAVTKYRSAGLGIRNSMRTSQMMPNVIQRDIKGTGKLGFGEWEIDFRKLDATTAGGLATEVGTLKFTPSRFSPRSNDIRLIQIVRTTDTSGPTEQDFNWTGGEADRNKMMTERNVPENVAGGFFVDHRADQVAPRTNSTDPAVPPFYRSYSPNVTLSQDGHNKSATDIQPASLADQPGDAAPGRFLFVTSAKAVDTGRYYGTALWGFEIFMDSGVAKIRGEYHRFREYRGQTFDKTLENFDNFYNNPDTPSAP